MQPHSDELALLAAIAEEPADLSRWLVLADWLDDRADPRGELMRAHVSCRACEPGTDNDDVRAAESRLRALLNDGVLPCVPRFTNSVGMEFVLIPPGRFRIGSPTDEPERDSNDLEPHTVTIPQPFWLGTTPVTQSQYEAVMGLNPSRHVGEAFGDTSRWPAERVAWRDAWQFCEALGAMAAEQATRRLYRLPTEAEWEAACRAAVPFSQPTHHGPTLSSVQANFDGNSPYNGGAKGVYREQPTPVKMFRPNAWGLFDLCGNVNEWCADVFESPGRRQTEPEETASRATRGGSWYWNGLHCRSAYRFGFTPAGSDKGTVGFRVVCGWSG